MPHAVEHELHRIAQEALNNILKHAHASNISVKVRRSGSRVVLEIADNGKGFNVTEGRLKGGLGLRGMEERAVKLGGKLTIASQSGKGSRVIAEITLPEAKKPNPQLGA
jgi:signal transduction histidine kinase